MDVDKLKTEYERVKEENGSLKNEVEVLKNQVLFLFRSYKCRINKKNNNEKFLIYLIYHF